VARGGYFLQIALATDVSSMDGRDKLGPYDSVHRNEMPRTPIHPGEILAEELAELNVSAAELSRQLKVSANRITGIINGELHQRRHCIAAWPLVRDKRRILAQSSKVI
jgi:hypothetical protein